MEAALDADDPNDAGDDPPLDMDLIRQKQDELDNNQHEMNNKRQEMNIKRQEMNNKQDELNNEQDKLNNKQGEVVSSLFDEVGRLRKVVADKEKNEIKLKKDVERAKMEAKQWKSKAYEQNTEAVKYYEKAEKEKEKNIKLKKKIDEMKKDDEECTNENLLEVVVDSMKMGDKSMLGPHAIANLIINNKDEMFALLMKDSPRESNNGELVALLEGHLGRGQYLGFNSTSRIINRMLPELSTLYEQQSDDDEEIDNRLKDLLVKMLKHRKFTDKKLSVDKWVSFLMKLKPDELSIIKQTCQSVQKNPY